MGIACQEAIAQEDITMHKYYFTTLGKDVACTRLYGQNLTLPPGLTKELLQDTQAKHKALLGAPGNLTDNMDKALSSLPMRSENGKQLFMVLPLNMVLWLYEQGNTDTASQTLFETIAKRSRELYKRRSEKYETQRIKLADMPVSERFKERLNNISVFHSAKNRKFLHLQALLAIMCCSARGLAEEPYDMAHSIVCEAAPGTMDTITGPVISGSPRNMYSAIYSERNKLWNIALLRCCQASEGIQLIRALIWRAKAEMPRVDAKRTSTISRLDFFLRLLLWLELSLEDDPLRCMDRENMAGSCKIW